MRTSKASRWLGRVKACPCVLCDALGQSLQSPTDAHHMRQSVACDANSIVSRCKRTSDLFGREAA